MKKSKNPFKKWKAKHHITVWGGLTTVWFLYSVITDEGIAKVFGIIFNSA